MEWMFPINYYNNQTQVIYRIQDEFIEPYDEPTHNFFKFYTPDLLARGIGQIPKLAPRSERICRFCDKSEPLVTFRKDAHVFPHFTGNSSLIHDVECDVCNEMFSRYETHFADHMGFFRTADAIAGKRGVPKFKNDGLNVYAEKEPDGKYNIIIEGSNPETSIYNEADDTILFKTKTTPYIPLYILKTLFKISYSVMPSMEINDYRIVKEIIMSDKFNGALKGRGDALQFTFDKAISAPLYISYRKRHEYTDQNIPTKVAMFYFGRFMYEYILINDNDKFLINDGSKARIIYCPPILPFGVEQPKIKKVNLSVAEKVKEENSYLFKFERD